jgi:hypothetical protein
MEAQLGLLQQQMEIERSVHAAVGEFLSSKAGQLQDDAGGWHSRREEDGRTKERALEVGGGGHAACSVMLAGGTAWHEEDGHRYWSWGGDALHEKFQKKTGKQPLLGS